MVQGYNGSQLWDTAFAAQAIIATDLIDEFGETLRKAHKYIKESQAFFLFFLHSFFSCFIRVFYLLNNSEIITYFLTLPSFWRC